MSTREILAQEIKTIPHSLLEELYNYLLFIKKRDVEKVSHLDSEKVLARDWDSPEEEEAWKNL